MPEIEIHRGRRNQHYKENRANEMNPRKGPTGCDNDAFL